MIKFSIKLQHAQNYNVQNTGFHVIRKRREQISLKRLTTWIANR